METVVDFSIETLAADIHTALKHWQTVQADSHSLLGYLYLVRKQRESIGLGTAAALRLATNQVLLAGLEELKKHDAQAATILQLRFLDKQKSSYVSHQLQISEDKVKRKQREGIQQLADILHAQEMIVREAHIQQLDSQLEAKSYTQLFGIDALSDDLLTKLELFQPPWVITLAGLGGIGKTSLANYTVRCAIRQFQFEDVVWLNVTNRQESTRPLFGPEKTFQQIIHNMSQQLLPALPAQTTLSERQQQIQQLIKAQRHLIIIDNLELKADTAFLLAQLVELANPSKFLLTSRTQPVHHAGTVTLPIPELSAAHSLRLIRHYAADIGFTEAATAQDGDLLPLYVAVGGNPFALKLLVSLATTRPLSQILHDIHAQQSPTGEEIYRHIFKEAWLMLSNEAKMLLTVMPLAADSGMDPEQMLSLSGLTKEQLWSAISELVGRSLLEVRGTMWQRVYGIHRLTESFLRSEIIPHV